MAENQKLQDEELQAVSGGDGGEPGYKHYCPKCKSDRKYTEYHREGSGCHAKLVCNMCGTELEVRHTS